MLATAHISFFNEILKERTSTDLEVRKIYGSDETEDLNFPPAIVLKPETVKEVSEIMRYCHENQITVTPAGARTGLSGGALCDHGGVLISMEKFNKIINID